MKAKFNPNLLHETSTSLQSTMLRRFHYFYNSVYTLLFLLRQAMRLFCMDTYCINLVKMWLATMTDFLFPPIFIYLLMIIKCSSCSKSVHIFITWNFIHNLLKLFLTSLNNTFIKKKFTKIMYLSFKSSLHIHLNSEIIDLTWNQTKFYKLVF